MGYRELLKKYIRFLELRLGDNYIEAVRATPESTLTDRDVAELRTLAGEIFREAHTAATANRIENFNYRLRLLFNRYDLSVERAAELAGVEPRVVRRWRTSPNSPRYLSMSEREFDRFEVALLQFIENELPEDVPKAVDGHTAPEVRGDSGSGVNRQRRHV